MKTKVEVVIFRHGETKNSSGMAILTPFGERQVRSIIQNLKLASIRPKQIFHSGELRTLKSAEIAQNELGFDEPLKAHKDLHYGEISNALGIDDESHLEELGTVLTAGNTLEAALKISEYARLMREQLTKAIIEMAAGGNAFGFSHNALASLASPNLDFPYNICTGDAIVYRIHDGLIESAEYVRCPI